MKVIKPYFVIMTPTEREEWAYWALLHLERAGRVCYKSEHKTAKGSAHDLLRRLLKSGHESVIEHVSISVRLVVDRGVSHEIVRHRLCSFSQESTRYANYGKEQFGREITVVDPCFWDREETKYKEWYEAMEAAERAYMALLDQGAKAQEARSVLPNSLKTEVFMTANLREWRTIFKQRCAMAAHPQMREVMQPLLQEFSNFIPVIFDDLVDKFFNMKMVTPGGPVVTE